MKDLIEKTREIFLSIVTILGFSAAFTLVVIITSKNSDFSDFLEIMVTSLIFVFGLIIFIVVAMLAWAEGFNLIGNKSRSKNVLGWILIITSILLFIIFILYFGKYSSYDPSCHPTATRYC